MLSAEPCGWTVELSEQFWAAYVSEKLGNIQQQNIELINVYCYIYVQGQS